MSLRFERRDGELIMEYLPDLMDKESLLQKLEREGVWDIKHCFSVTVARIREDEEGRFESEGIYFCIGSVGEAYTTIDPEVLGTSNGFHFDNKIRLKENMFIAHRGISIFRKLDKVISMEAYIGEEDAPGCNFPFEVFKELIQRFPKTTELNHYANSKIARIVKEYFADAEIYEERFERFLERNEKNSGSDGKARFQQYSRLTELEQFEVVNSELRQMLNDAENIDEATWQEKICDIIRVLYPKYIASVREMKIHGADKHDKKPDFLLVDANGYVDVMEIKKPSVQILSEQPIYRNNYISTREFVGTVQQIEKYIYCLRHWGETGEKCLSEDKKLMAILPDGLLPKIINPQGILLLGRSNNFKEQRERDFELIKRQYRNVADIMTYDDLVWRVQNIIGALRKSIATSGNK
ncbi:MAG: DUF4263 domain-containing protein [Oscillospiraceae bacterium]|nr:DUF4263 domain-containing protein [Oscillospiraceae bacterium]